MCQTQRPTFDGEFRLAFSCPRCVFRDHFHFAGIWFQRILYDHGLRAVRFAFYRMTVISFNWRSTDHPLNLRCWLPSDQTREFWFLVLGYCDIRKTFLKCWRIVEGCKVNQTEYTGWWLRAVFIEGKYKVLDITTIWKVYHSWLNHDCQFYFECVSKTKLTIFLVNVSFSRHGRCSDRMW